jgi:copper chaperone CopZ
VLPEAEDVDVFVEPHHTVIQVNGVVCSFCAYGAEKSLSKLDGLDRSEFGNGVLVDIHTQRITLAMTPGTEIPIEDIHRRIRKAGYDPVAVYLRIAGTLESVGGNLLTLIEQ